MEGRMALTNKRVEAEFDATIRRFKLYASGARKSAEKAKRRSKARTDWTARAEVWEGAALELEQAKAVLLARR